MSGGGGAPSGGRIAGAVLVAGVVNLVIGMSGAMLWAGAAVQEAFAASGYEMPATPAVFVSHTLQRLAIGGVFVALYLLARRSAPSARVAAVVAGALGWVALYLMSFWLLTSYGIFPPSLAGWASLWGLLEAGVTTGAAMWVLERGRA